MRRNSPTLTFTMKGVEKNCMFTVIVFGITFGLPFSIGLQCYDCGELSIITADSNACAMNLGSCVYDLSTGGLKGIGNTHAHLFNSSAPVREVCYSLRGKFRGESLRMGGCDALPLEDVDSEHCLDPDFKVWFETESGREYITEKSFCICGTDFCNRVPAGGSVRVNSWTYFLFIETVLVIISFSRISF
ncbi:uncharacterized protein LOC110847493 [Folsomia candida]|uniref:Uncharacterized protein n=1 Tax=Folsomia candida TaxID=158441 RepID=A0A226EI10_FOLCA|nr:uncharacterized protein LOC110847493 [Folsomia candida]OXA57333.1 hypothetical protein Fcan01_07013 [Folsomia candida]